MTKLEIDYSNTIIYKISCKDSNITDVYVGHTTNFVQRKHSHKQNCINEKSSSYSFKLYKTIRSNGGWDNWKMEIVDFFNCKDQYEARKKEQEYFELLNSTLNSIEPIPKQKICNKKVKESLFYCETCNIYCATTKLFEIHNHTKHMTCSDSLNKYYCQQCNYFTSKKTNYTKHLSTNKHKICKYDIYLPENDCEKSTKVKENDYKCKCGKSYKYDSGYYRHKKTCKFVHNDDSSKINIQKQCELIMTIIKDNKEFKDFMMEQQNQVSNLLDKFSK